MKGPKPKPNELKRRSGSRHAKPSSLVAGRVKPRMPAYLSPMAKTAWKQIVGDMEKGGILDGADGALVEVASNLLAEYRRAVKACSTHGSVCEGQKGNPTTSPDYRIVMETGKELRQLFEHLGIGPIARSRLGTAGTATRDMAAEMNDRVGEKGLRVVQGGRG